MEAQAKERTAGNTLDVVDKLRSAREAVVAKLATVPDAALVAKCEAMLIGFDELVGTVRRLAPDVEQMKGLTKGLQLACPMIKQHVKILQDKLSDPDQGSLLKFGRDVVINCHDSIEGAWRKQREEMVRVMGRFDGSVNGALAVLRRVEGVVSNYERLLEEEKEIDRDPFAEVRNPPEPEQQVGGNGARAEKKTTKRKTTKRKTTRKSKKAAEEQPN